jgi:DNA-binding CsgD family transcriptional regulator
MLLRLGEVPEAEVDARTAHDLCVELNWTLCDAFCLAMLITALVERGALDEAGALLSRPPWGLPATALPPDSNCSLVLWARGRLRRAQGRPQEAAEDLIECGRRQIAMDDNNPAVCGWRSEAALALAALGDMGPAAGLADEGVELARSFGAPGSLGIALRAAGLVAGGDSGLRILEKALEVLEVSSARLERARALVDYGGALRRAGRRGQARWHLTKGLDLAHACGAAALEEYAVAELHATGARPRRLAITGLDALTPTERRVAELVAQGLSNRETAQGLFVTVRTVEFHLGAVFRKLGIASRTQMSQALRAGGQ